MASFGSEKTREVDREAVTIIPLSLSEEKAGRRVRMTYIPEKGGVMVVASEDQLRPGGFGRLTYNPLQTAVLRWRVPLEGTDDWPNLLIAAKMGSGKTMAAEIACRRGMEIGSVVYVSPLRMLAEQMVRKWKAPGHPWSDRKIEVLTGDYRLTGAKRKALAVADIVVVTAEMLGARCRRFSEERNTWLTQVRHLVVDEAHLLGEEGRGGHLEAALVNFTKLNTVAQLILLSGTLGNDLEVAEWLSVLTDRDTQVIRSDWAPVEVVIHLKGYQGGKRWDHGDRVRREGDGAYKLIQSFPPEDQVLVFFHSVAAGKRMQARLRRDGQDAEFLYAGLTLEKRNEILRAYEEKKLRILVSTSAGAQGIDTPARWGVVVGINRGQEEVSPTQIQQMCGRIGRVGYADRGDVYVLIDRRVSGSWAKKLAAPPVVKSQIACPEDLGFHLVAGIDGGEIVDLTDAMNWAERTLAQMQTGRWTHERVSDVLEGLRKYDVIGEDVEGTLTTLESGHASALFYLDPQDLVLWTQNWRTVFARDLSRDSTAIAWAVCNVGHRDDWWLPSDPETGEIVNRFLQNQKGCGLRIRGESQRAGAVALWRYLEDMRRSTIGPALKTIHLDLDRWIAAWKILDTAGGVGAPKGFWDHLAARLRYGASWEAADFCRLEGIGRVAAERLVEAGVRTFGDFARKREEVLTVIGNAEYLEAVHHLRALHREGEAEVILNDKEGN